ncbi:hypothetical protein BCR34DRAFT_571674 [Clohesyomyces aquaticus]|uniref:Uncharacterized protein n=1 Tax=Clohesyomyces aquaticus TaxID=1231657 RepID=A0A1Y1Z6M2_9PLEO|nr:hypothetical protein BCR34DRAFT_571674 [Clohesyomyces aquaticus]
MGGPGTRASEVVQCRCGGKMWLIGCFPPQHHQNECRSGLPASNRLRCGKSHRCD